MGYDVYEAAETIKEWACFNVNESIAGHTIDIEDIVESYTSLDGKVSVEDIVSAVSDALDQIEYTGVVSAGVWFPTNADDIDRIFAANEAECMERISECYVGLGDFESLYDIKNAGVDLLIHTVAESQLYELQQALDDLHDELVDLGIPTEEELEEETL